MKHTKWLGIIALMVLTVLGFIACSSDGRNGRSGSVPLTSDDVGLQLWTIRGLVLPDQGSPDHRGDFEYIKSLLSEVKNIGYRNIEPNDYWGLTPEQWKQILDDVGLKVSGIHHGIPGNGGDPAAAVDQEDITTLKSYLDVFGLDYSIINYAGWTTEAEWNTFYESLTAYVDALHTAGIKVGFHSHNHEYAHFQDAESRSVTKNKRVYDKIVQTVDFVEIDLHWSFRGGMDPVQAIKEYTDGDGRYHQYKDKLRYLHMKDISLLYRDGNDTPFRFEELGGGTINWPEVVKAGKEQGVKYYIVEQDADYMPDLEGTGFASKGQIRSITTSYEYLARFFDSKYQYPSRPKLASYSNKIKPEQVSIQLYNFRGPEAGHNGDKGWIKTNILQKVKDAGYQNVEPYNTWGLTGAEWAEILNAVGLKVSSWHQGITADESVIASLISVWKELPTPEGKGLTHVFINSLNFKEYDDPSTAANLADIAAFRETMRTFDPGYPVTVNYHTHSQEFEQPADSKDTPFAGIVLTGAKIELDTHWALRAGVNTVDLMLQYPKDITYLHIKDASFTPTKAAADAITETLNYNYEEIGDGVFKWDDIFRAANYIGVKYFVVEQDANYIGGSATYGDYTSGDPFASAKRSYDYLKAHHF
jgi:sugar phosphate isomerase/epimerase